MGLTERTENNADNRLSSKPTMVDVNALEIGTSDMTIGHNRIRVGISKNKSHIKIPSALSHQFWHFRLLGHLEGC